MNATAVNSDLVGVREIANLAGVRPSAVSNWRRRYHGYTPDAVVTLALGLIYRREQILAPLTSHCHVDSSLAPLGNLLQQCSDILSHQTTTTVPPVAKGGHPHQKRSTGSRPEPVEPTLIDAGVSKKLSSRAQKVAAFWATTFLKSFTGSAC